MGSRPAGNDAGFAAVDALVALTILAVTFSLAFDAVNSARRLAVASVEIRKAHALLEYLVDAGPRGVGLSWGRSDGFDWRLQTTLKAIDPHAPSVRMCSRAAAAVGVRSRRRFVLSTLEFCKPPEPPA